MGRKTGPQRRAEQAARRKARLSEREAKRQSYYTLKTDLTENDSTPVTEPPAKNKYGKEAAGDDFFLSYPLKRNEQEDSLILQAVKYLPPSAKSGEGLGLSLIHI